MTTSEQEVHVDDCNLWFPGCDIEYRDGYAEIHDGLLVGNCGKCGAQHTKPVEVAYQEENGEEPDQPPKRNSRR